MISHPLDSAALHVLTRTTGGMTGRRVAQLAREGSQQGIGKALGRLVDVGLVNQRSAGSAILYELNRDHLAAPAVEQLTKLRRTFLERLEATFAGWERPPRHASMFGSAARADGDESSDIDLFLVRPDTVDEEDSIWRDQVGRLADDVMAWTGNRAGVAEVSESSLVDLNRRRPPIVTSLEEDAMTLAGPDIQALLENAA